MDARYSIRKAQLLEECQVAPEIFAQVLPRLRTFMEPFIATLQGQAPRPPAQTYVRGLLSDVERNDVESMASHFGQDRLGLQGFIGWDDWDDTPLRHTLRALARVAKAGHRIEECLQRSKSEAGLADYEVRNWTGWHHHHTLSLLATWFLERETHREKNGPRR